MPAEPDAPVLTVADLGRDRLVAVTEALGALGRRLDALRAKVAAEVEHESRRELGPDSLAKQQGFRTASVLIAANTGISTGEAVRLTNLGKALAPRRSLGGQALPAKHPHVAEAVERGVLTAAAASAIVTMLDRVSLRAAAEKRDEAERLLCSLAPGLPLEGVRKVVAQAEAWLDPDGLEPAEFDRHRARSLSLYERDGMLHVSATVDVVTGAPLKAAIDALVTAGFRRAKADVIADDGEAPPTAAQLRADALIQLAEHAVNCNSSDLPLEGVTAVVRISLSDLRDGTGCAEIDGIAGPVSTAAARRLAASARIIPCVLDGESEILDWGRSKRLFTPAQRLALVERDGGCAMCNLPPGMTKAHHIRWWARDAGPTDLANGVLLCESCHHRIHDNDWEVHIDGPGAAGRVWFIPPPHVDPRRRPRLGGRVRFEFPGARAA